jgi:hypothetical protein
MFWYMCLGGGILAARLKSMPRLSACMRDFSLASDHISLTPLNISHPKLVLSGYNTFVSSSDFLHGPIAQLNFL